jgi:hypothetical protein
MNGWVERNRIVIGAAVVALMLVAALYQVRDVATAVFGIALVLVMGGAVPFVVGFAAQLLARRHVLGDRVFLGISVLLTAIWWFTGQGFTFTMLRSKLMTAAATVVFLTWFAGLGASAGRAVQRRWSARRMARATEA